MGNPKEVDLKETKEVSKLALKTFNIDEKTYKQYSDHCKKQGISMSKQVENFIKYELENLKSNKTEKSHSKAEHQQAAHESPAHIHPSEHKEEHSFAKYC